MKKLMKPMPSAYHPPSVALGLLTSLILSICSAQEVTPQLEVQGTVGKKVYTNVKVMSVTPQGVKIAHDDGISVVPVGYLPKEWLDKYAPGASTMPQATSDAPPAAAKGTPQAASTPARAAAVTMTDGTSASEKQAVVTSFEPSCLVFIKTNNSNGSGFIAKVDGATYIYTNAHVLCGTQKAFTSKIISIQTASGHNIPIPRELELSDMPSNSDENGLEDLARIPIKIEGDEKAYEISELNANVSMGSKVVAYGNSLGGNVFTALEGIVVGVGSDRIEISSEIVPGNSGGPVVLEESKKVIGLSSYLIGGQQDIWTDGTKFERVRRFALRPDKVTKWRKMLFSSLATSLSELTAFERDTLSLAAASYLSPKSNYAGFDLRLNSRGDYDIQKVLREGSKYSLGQTIASAVARVNQRLGVGMGGSGTRMAKQGVKGFFAEFYNTVAAASATQLQALETSERSAYLKKLIPEMVRLRKEAHQAFLREAAQFK